MQEPSAARPAELDNRVIIMNGFRHDEIVRIMRVIKTLFDKPRDLIFATTTPSSLQMKLADLIVDMSRDHRYLAENPPQLPQHRAPTEEDDLDARPH